MRWASFKFPPINLWIIGAWNEFQKNVLLEEPERATPDQPGNRTNAEREDDAVQKEPTAS